MTPSTRRASLKRKSKPVERWEKPAHLYDDARIRRHNSFRIVRGAVLYENDYDYILINLLLNEETSKLKQIRNADSDHFLQCLLNLFSSDLCAKPPDILVPIIWLYHSDVKTILSILDRCFCLPTFQNWVNQLINSPSTCSFLAFFINTKEDIIRFVEIINLIYIRIYQNEQFIALFTNIILNPSTINSLIDKHKLILFTMRINHNEALLLSTIQIILDAKIPDCKLIYDMLKQFNCQLKENQKTTLLKSLIINQKEIRDLFSMHKLLSCFVGKLDSTLPFVFNDPELVSLKTPDFKTLICQLSNIFLFWKPDLHTILRPIMINIYYMLSSDFIIPTKYNKLWVTVGEKLSNFALETRRLTNIPFIEIVKKQFSRMDPSNMKKFAKSFDVFVTIFSEQ